MKNTKQTKTIVSVVLSLAFVSFASAQFETFGNPQANYHPTKNGKFDSRTNAVRGSYHTGVDSTGSPEILAMASGTISAMVTNGQNDHGFGNCIIILHELRYGGVKYSMYGHMDSLVGGLQVGDRVVKGQKIGMIGGTGYGERYHWDIHLHTETKDGNVTSNPKGSGTYYGYTPTSATGFGYSNPADYINKVEVIQVGQLADGLYRASNEATVFWVSSGQRHAIPNGECFEQRFGANAWGQIKVVDSQVIYLKTAWAPPISYLVRNRFEATVYWVTESMNNGVPTGRLIARPISSAQVFDGMHFDWNEISVVDYNPAQRFGMGTLIDTVEPRIVVRDGAYVRFNNNNFYAGWRVENLSDANLVGMAITTRICHRNGTGSEDGAWRDFPWVGTGGLDKNYRDPQGNLGWSPDWTAISNSAMQPRGYWNIKVIYSFTVHGKNVQERAIGKGELPLDSSESIMWAG